MERDCSQSMNQELQVELVQTTSVMNRKINLNCTFDGSNVIYLAGSNIVFHNVFHNVKHFKQRLNDYPVLAMAFHRSAQVSTAIITKVPSPEPLCMLEFYLADSKPTQIQLHEDLNIYDMIFLERNKVCMLCEDYIINRPMMLIVLNHRKLKRIVLEDPLVKFNLGDHRLLLTKKGRGCVQLNPDTEEFQSTLHQNLEIKEIINLEQAEIVVTEDSHLHAFVEGIQVQEFRLQEHRKGQWGMGVKVGRNIVFSFKGQLAMGYIQWAEGRLNWVSCFQYNERIKANVLCLQCSPDEMNMAIGVQIFYKDSWTMEHFMFNLAALSSEKKFINAFTRLAPNGAENGDCLSMQKVISSQIFLLSGPSIVNYSYVDHIEKKHKYFIHESPRLIAVHPLGYQILCTFEGAIRFYQKVEMELIQIWTEPWLCSAAKYTDSGLLLLCIFEEGSHQMILYDPNSFTRLRNYPNLYLKQAITSIEINENETQMILWSNKDLSVYKLKTGERLSEFREKKEKIQGFQVNCAQYDGNRRSIILGMNKKIVVCSKAEEYLLNFSNQKHFFIDENITCLIIREQAQLAFLGTKNGKILLTRYPFEGSQETLNNEVVAKISYKSIRVHSSPTSDLLLSNNGKFLFAASKGEGLGILKIRKNGGVGHFYNPFDISNYNFIQTSSKPYLETVQERLKSLLQKRKAIFNELDEYKKDWEGKRQRQSKTRNFQQKKQELSTVNNALDEINKARKECDTLTAQLHEIRELENKTANEFQTANHDEMLIKYAENDKLKERLQNTEKSCANQCWQIEQECQLNLSEIQNELSNKFTEFQENYQLMKQNLINFAIRTQIEEKEEAILKEQEIQNTRIKLRKEEDDLYKKNNELKADITRNKKQLERFLNRRDFLQNKERFFRQELKYCQKQYQELNEIKGELEHQLRDLQNETEKKEKRLRKYFIQNQMLIKYQLVYNNISKATQREAQFLEKQSSTLKNQISLLQKELLLVSQNRNKVIKDIGKKEEQSHQAKCQIKQLKNRSQYLDLQIKQLQRLLSTVTPGKQNELQGLYERFFVKKRLEGALECGRFEEKEKAEAKQIEVKIKQELQAHKNYLVYNMETFQKCNAKVFDQMQNSYMKYQSENYALIGQCNSRKEQLAKKKKNLQEMVNSMRETENHIQKLQNGTYKAPPKKVDLEHRVIPFVEYQKQQFLRKEFSQPSLHKSRHTVTHVRKLLDVQKCPLPESRVKPARRIQTAQVKKNVQEPNQEQPVEVNEGDNLGWFITKPQTASMKRRGAQQEAKRLFSRGKISSKPTTCKSHSKYSVFI